LIDIVEGVELAQASLLKSKAIINPNGYPKLAKLNKGIDVDFSGVEFDVQIEAKNITKGSGGGKAAIYVVRASIAGEKEILNSHVNRIKFSVPIFYPPGNIVKEQE
jgi:hypothetical protein